MRPRTSVLAAVAALAGLGATVAPQPVGSPMPIPREYVKGQQVTRRQRKKKRAKQLPIDGKPYTGPRIVVGAVNLYGLPALTPRRIAMVADKHRALVRNAYGNAHASLVKSKGSQAVHRARRESLRATTTQRAAA